MKPTIDKFQARLSDYFRQLTLAIAYCNIGQNIIAGSPPTASVTLQLDKEIFTERLYLKELLVHSNAIGDSILELFQNKIIAAWCDLIDCLFLKKVEMHFHKTCNFSELKKRTVKLDFSSQSNYEDQIKYAIFKDFKFEKYKDRFKLINNCLNPNSILVSESAIVMKHVQIRNSIQHHDSKVYADMLTELGVACLKVLNGEANEVQINEGDRVQLSIPELDLLKRSLFLLSQEWRGNCA